MTLRESIESPGFQHGNPIPAAARKGPFLFYEFRGVTIPAGHHVEHILFSANRDEGRFANPDVFDIERNEKDHQAFGGGQHFCAGLFFGRQVQRIMFEELLAATKDVTRTPDTSVPVTGWVFRAPRSIPVDLRSA